jgi:hypothetical protein
VLLGDAPRRARRAQARRPGLHTRRESVRIERRWNAKITLPKHGSRGTIAMVEPLRERLLALPRESEWAFTTLRGNQYVPSMSSHH